MEHIERNGSSRNLIFGCKREPGLGIDVVPNEPRGCAPIDSRPWPRHPHSAFVVFYADLSILRHWFTRTRHAGTLQQFPNAFLQGTIKEVDFNDFLKTILQAAQASGGLFLQWPRRPGL